MTKIERTGRSRPAPILGGNEPPNGRPKRASERYILPSRRVAEFLLPNTGEYMELQRTTISSAAAAGDDPSKLASIFHLGGAGVRKLLLAMSAAPVSPIYLPTWDPGTARAAALETARERVRAEWAAFRKLTPEQRLGVARTPITVQDPTDEDEVEAAIEERAERLSESVFQDLQYEAEDTDAMRAAANCTTISELVWDMPDSFINRMPKSMPGTPEARDWVALHQIAISIFGRTAALINGTATEDLTDPKAEKVRPWR